MQDTARRRRTLGRVAAAAAILAAALAAFLLTRPVDLPSQAATTYRAVRDGSLMLQMETSDAATLERFLAHRGLPFDTRVLELGAMGFELSGGRVHALGGRPSSAFAYRDAAGRWIVCQMYRGRVGDLARGFVEQRHGSLTLRTYRRRGVTLVVWQEGDVVCMLAGDLEAEDVERLALAKARAGRGRDLRDGL